MTGAETVAPQRMPWLRYTVLVLTVLQLALIAYLEIDFLVRAPSMDMLTRSMSQDYALISMIPFVVFTLPALILALMGRWLWFALALAIVPILMTAAVFAFFAMK